MRNARSYVDHLKALGYWAKLQPAQKLAVYYMLMVSAAGDFYAKLKTFEEDEGLDRSVLSKAMHKLQEWGILEQTKPSDGRSAGRYRFKPIPGAALKYDLRENTPGKSGAFRAQAVANGHKQNRPNGHRSPADTSIGNRNLRSSRRELSAATQKMIDWGFNAGGRLGAVAAEEKYGAEAMAWAWEKFTKKKPDKQNGTALYSIIWSDIPVWLRAQESKQNAQLLKKQQVERQTKEQRDADLVRDANRLKWGEEKPAFKIKRLEGLKVKYPDFRRMIDAALKNPAKASDNVIGLVYAS